MVFTHGWKNSLKVLIQALWTPCNDSWVNVSKNCRQLNLLRFLCLLRVMWFPWTVTISINFLTSLCRWIRLCFLMLKIVGDVGRIYATWKKLFHTTRNLWLLKTKLNGYWLKKWIWISWSHWLVHKSFRMKQIVLVLSTSTPPRVCRISAVPWTVLSTVWHPLTPPC